MTDIVEEMRDAMISTLLLVGKGLEDDDVLQLAEAAHTIVERRIGEQQREIAALKERLGE
jgi:hypothetical protein